MCLLANSVNPKSAKDEQKTTALSTALAKSIIIFSIECVFTIRCRHFKGATISTLTLKIIAKNAIIRL